MPLKVKTSPSRKPRTLPYCVLAIALRGVVQFPGAWCDGVITSSEALASRAVATPIPAATESSIASRRLNFSESGPCGIVFSSWSDYVNRASLAWIDGAFHWSGELVRKRSRQTIAVYVFAEEVGVD